MFGLVVDNVLYLKVDKQTKQSFIDQSLEPFGYFKKGREFKISYYQAPEECLEDSQVMCLWATKAFAVACSASTK